MSFRDELLLALKNNHGVDVNTVADNLADAINGETVKKTYKVNDAGEEVLTGVTTTATPTDKLNGAILFDALTGGKLGIAPKQFKPTSAGDVAHKRLETDNRILAFEDPE